MLEPTILAQNENANYLMKIDLPQEVSLQPSEFLDRLHDRLHLLVHGLHRLLFEIHLLCERQHLLGSRPRNCRAAVAVCHDDVARGGPTDVARYWSRAAREEG